MEKHRRDGDLDLPQAETGHGSSAAPALQQLNHAKSRLQSVLRIVVPGVQGQVIEVAPGKHVFDVPEESVDHRGIGIRILAMDRGPSEGRHGVDVLGVNQGEKHAAGGGS